MRVRNFEKFSCRFGKRDIQAFLAEADTLQEELEGDCGLSRTRVALYEIEVIAGEAAAENVVEAIDAGGQQFNRGETLPLCDARSAADFSDVVSNVVWESNITTCLA